jgi:hypothetical protein
MGWGKGKFQEMIVGEKGFSLQNLVDMKGDLP